MTSINSLLEELRSAIYVSDQRTVNSKILDILKALSENQTMDVSAFQAFDRDGDGRPGGSTKTFSTAIGIHTAAGPTDAVAPKKKSKPKTPPVLTVVETDKKDD